MFIFNIAPVHPVHTVNSFLTLLSEASLMRKKKKKAYGMILITHHLGEKKEKAEKLLKDLSFHASMWEHGTLFKTFKI